MQSFSAARLARSRAATAVVFVILGLLQGTLAARMPAIKAHAHLSDGTLGFALLGLPVGSIAAIQVTGRSIARWGSSPVTLAGVVVLCCSVVAPPFATGLPALLVSLIVFGIGMGLTDTAMNAHAVTVARAYERPIMSSFHGFASLGALVGSAAGGIAAHLDVDPKVHFAIAGAVCLAAGFGLRTSLLPASVDAHSHDQRAAGDHRAPWSTALVLLAATAFLSMLAELAVGDWSAVYLRDSLGSPASIAAYGYAGFAFAMTCARFFGDGITARLGYSSVLRWGGLSAGIALVFGLLAGSVAGAMISWAIVGIGMAGIVPIVFTVAGNLRGVPHGGALSKVAGVGYTGSLVGPPLIGLVAGATSLKTALFVIAAACLAVGVIGPIAARRGARDA
jgi:MFS family permease